MRVEAEQLAMSYFHVMISVRTPSSRPEIELDVVFEELESRFLRPYGLGNPMVISGRTITARELERIQIFETKCDSNVVNAEIRARDRISNVARPTDTHGRYDPLLLSRHGTDVTRKYILGPPGHALDPQRQAREKVRPVENAKEVFVVFGRNNKAREAMFAFLRSIDLTPLEWSVVREDTSKPSPYIGEILQAAFSRAHAVVVLLTPDDEVRLKAELLADEDPTHERQLTGQARPNVLFEAGMAMGSRPDRVVLVELGNLRPFTDIAGLHTVKMDGSTVRRQELALKLRTAGCPVNLSGEDWHTAGNFDTSIIGEGGGREVSVQMTAKSSTDHMLSDDATELLLEATSDGAAIIYAVRTMKGLTIQTNGREFSKPGDPRSEARWKEALKILRQQDIVEALNAKGETFQITQRGFDLADSIQDKD